MGKKKTLDTLEAFRIQGELFRALSQTIAYAVEFDVKAVRRCLADYNTLLEAYKQLDPDQGD